MNILVGFLLGVFLFAVLPLGVSILGRWLARCDAIDAFFERLDDFIDKVVDWLDR